MIQGPNYQEDITIINIYTPDFRLAKYIIYKALTELKGEAGNNTLIIGDFNSPLSTVHRTFGQKASKKILDLNDIIDCMDLKDINRRFHPTIAEPYSFQVHINLSQGWITCWVTKQDSANLRRL